MYWPIIETPRLKSNEKMGGPTILITGIIISLWANCTFVLTICDGYIDSPSWFLIITGFISHILISVANSFAVSEGIRQTKPDFLKPWMITKTVELVAVMIGILIQCFSYYKRFIGLVPVGILIILIGSYINLCVYTTWKKLKEPQPQPPTDIESIDLEKPPSYDSFANQTDVIEPWIQFETPRFRNNKKICEPIILITGILVSLWVHSYVLVKVIYIRFYSSTCYLVTVSFISHIIISVASTIAASKGFHTSNLHYVRPWIITKRIELSVVFLGSIEQFFNLGLIIFCVGFYVYLCVSKTWRKMKEDLQSRSAELESVDLDQPPTYEHSTTQTNVI